MTRSKDAGSGKLSMKRGRPNAQAALRIERAILATARGMFVTEGFDGLSMERIAAAAGITRVTLYNRYPTKEMLFRAVVEDMVSQRYSAARTDAVGGLTDIRDILYRRVADMAAL